MRQRIIAAVAALILVFAMAPAATYAATQQGQDEALLLKKKKREAAQKAAEERRKAAEAKKKAEEKKRAAAKKALEKKKASNLEERRRARLKAESELRKRRAERIASRRECGNFLNCVFRSQTTTTRRSSGFGFGSGLSSRSTKRVVAWNDSKYKPGTLIVRTPERALYYVTGDGEAIRYSVGVGREGFQWSGSSRIAGKREWPDWRPPDEMRRREAEKGNILPEVMEGGPGNPLGARALYIGGTLFRVHGTNNAASIGGAVSSGCIRMMNSDVIDLYNRVKVGSRIYVYQ
jgi:lipoprotein-anchoring transpeptidase ErfK/SrfK